MKLIFKSISSELRKIVTIFSLFWVNFWDFLFYSDMPGYQAPHGGTVPPHVLVTALKPDIVITSSVSRGVIVFKLTCPWDANISRSHNFKAENLPHLSLIFPNATLCLFTLSKCPLEGRWQNTIDLKCCRANHAMAKSLICISSNAASLSSYSIFSARGEPKCHHW